MAAKIPHPSSRDSISSALYTMLAHAGALAIALVPLWCVLIPPLVDYPNHLARAFINSELTSNEVLTRFYVSDWSLIPNLALDAVLFLLTPFFSIFTAGKLALALTFLVWTLACPLLHYALFRRFTTWTLLPLLFLYNGPLAWGFVSYLMGAGLALLFLAAWIASEARSSMLRLVLLAALSLTLFFAHLIALGLFCVLIGSYELQKLLTCSRPLNRRALSFFAGTIVALALPFALLLRVTPQHGPLVTVYGGAVRKVEALLSPTLQYTPDADIALFGLVLGIVVVALITGRARFERRMALPLALLALVALLVPTKLLGVDYFDSRAPLLAATVGIVGCRVRLAAPREGWLLAIVLLAAMTGRAWSVHQNWSALDREIKEFVSASRNIEVGSRLLTAYGDQRRGLFADNLHAQTTALAVIGRLAFWPNLYTGAHVLKAAPAVAHLDAGQTFAAPLPWLLDELAAARGERPPHPRIIPSYLKRWHENFDYLVIFLKIEDPSRFPPNLEVVARGSYFSIYRIRRATGHSQERPQTAHPGIAATSAYGGGTAILHARWRLRGTSRPPCRRADSPTTIAQAASVRGARAEEGQFSFVWSLKR